MQILAASNRDLDELVELLRDSVDSGASIGFIKPLADDVARSFWRAMLDEAARGERLLFVARDEAQRLVGSVQLALASKPNALHRAEVQKLIVHTAARGRGAGEELMHFIEAEALRIGRTLLILDTRKGDAASRLYARIGWQFAGEVPHYVKNEAGEYQSTLIFYKILD